MPISDRVKALQEQSGMTTAELATAANLPVDTITKIRTGTTRAPSTDTLLRLAAAFNVTLDELVNGLPVPSTTAPANDVAAAYESAMYLQAERYDNRMAMLVKDRDRWRQIAFIILGVCITLLVANLLLLSCMYWDLSHPDAGKILYAVNSGLLG